MNKITTTLLLFISMTMYSQTDSIKTHYLKGVNIERNKIRTSNTFENIQIIGKKEINLLAVNNLDDLLNKINGLDIRKRGTGGVQADISIRGGSFDQVIVLLNGINITDPQTGHYNLDIPIDIEDINRIEILQSAAAREYGANAFSGIINIITGENTRNYIKSNNKAGSYGFISQGISGNYDSNNFQNFASVSYQKSDGYIKNTDYQIVNGFYQAKIKSKNAGIYHLQLSSQLKKYGANSFYSLKYPYQFENTKTFISSLEWNYAKSIFYITTQASWRSHLDKFDLFRYSDDNIPYYHKTDAINGRTNININFNNLGNTNITLLARNEHIYSNNLGNTMNKKIEVPFENDSAFYTKEDNRFLFEVLLNHTINIQKWQLSGGVSSTFNKQFGTFFNGGMDISYKTTRTLNLYSSLNTATRLPTFTELYYHDPIHNSNPDLKPEKSVTIETGGKYTTKRLYVNGDIYYRWGKNIIDWTKRSDGEIWLSKNITDVNALGTDISIEYNFIKSFIKTTKFSYSYLTLDKTTENGYDSQYALDYLKNKIDIIIFHNIWRNVSGGLDMSWNNRAGNYSTNGISYNYKPYFLANYKLQWNNDYIKIFTDFNNLFNTQYVMYGGLKQPGFNFTTGISIKI